MAQSFSEWPESPQNPFFLRQTGGFVVEGVGFELGE